jgi:MFS transporter, DHA1 family, inner membrane transport protein
MESQGSRALDSRVEPWIALALCVAVALGRIVEQLLSAQQADAPATGATWLPLAAAAFAAAGIVPLDGWPLWLRVQRASCWIALLLMVWAASGLPFDLLRMTGTMGRRTASGTIVIATVNWPGFATRTLALAAAVVLAHLALARPAGRASTRPATWYGYAAFVLALPYPVLRAVWALGGTTGLSRPGAGGEGYAPLLLAIPWVAAAVLSLLLVPTWHWVPRRLLLFAGWTATAIVGMIGPPAVWALVSALAAPAASAPSGAEAPGIATWVFALFYGSWFLWAIAACAATRSYQLRSANSADVLADVHVRA